MSDLLAVLHEARALVASSSDADYDYSSWRDREHALSELDSLIASVSRDHIPRSTIAVIFAPTGPLQEVSLSAGFADAFCSLADRADAALA